MKTNFNVVPTHPLSAPEWIPPTSRLHSHDLLFDFLFIFILSTVGIFFFTEKITYFTLMILSSFWFLSIGLYFCSLWLPEVSFSSLLFYENILLSTLTGEVYHCWTDVPSKYGIWKLHNLVVRGNNPFVSSSSSITESSSSSSIASDSSSSTATLPSLVLLHGHSSGAALWECILNKLSVTVPQILVLDLPGWGRSPFHPSLNPAKLRHPDTIIDLLVDILEQWAQQRLSHQSIILVGHSFGGFLAIHWAKKYPYRIYQLLLIAPVGIIPLMPDPNAYRWGLFFRYLPPQRVARMFGRLGYFIFRTAYLRTTTEDKRFPDYYYQLAANTRYTGAGDNIVQPFLRFSWRGGLWWTRPCLSLLMNELSTVPITLIWGTQDELLAPTIGVLIHRIRPLTDIYFIHKGYHNPAHTNAQAVTDALMHAIYSYRLRTYALKSRILSSSFDSLDILQPENATEKKDTTKRVQAESSISASLPHSVTDCLAHVYPFTRIPKESSGLGIDIENLLTTEQILMKDKDTSDANVQALLHPLTVPSPSSSAPSSRFPLRSTHQSLPLYGSGRGYCESCHYLVSLCKSYWRCHCGAWSFNSSIQYSLTVIHFQYFLQFLDELYVHGNFNARTSRSIIMYVKTRTPLPTVLPVITDSRDSRMKETDAERRTKKERADGQVSNTNIGRTVITDSTEVPLRPNKARDKDEEIDTNGTSTEENLGTTVLEGIGSGNRSSRLEMVMDDLYQSTAGLSYTANSLLGEVGADIVPMVQFTGTTDMSIVRGKVYLIK